MVYTDFEKQIADIGDYKRKAEFTARALQKTILLREKAEKVEHCGDWLRRFTVESPINGTDEKLLGSFCRERMCPQCQRRKALKTFSDVMRITERLENYKFIHLVLTVRNVSAQELPARATKLFKSSSLLFRLPECKNAFKGVLRAFEITYNRERDDYHPHLHCMIAVNPSYFKSRYYLRQELIVQLWRKCYDGGDGNGGAFVERATETASAVAEVAKYAVKPFDLGLPEDEYARVLDDLFSALKGRRSIQLFGVFRDVARELKIEVGEDEREISLPLVGRSDYIYNRTIGEYVEFITPADELESELKLKRR